MDDLVRRAGVAWQAREWLSAAWQAPVTRTWADLHPVT
jgi:hypothetical protein